MEKYETPMVEIVSFDAEDVITTSPPDDLLERD
ncbi:MAG: hypothetical protein BWZ04_01434 [Firmicutes bacterium ADurb.BinA205]|mgnify:CR=1 FL=1|nr:MAG: hypothetical protein BWZ04_01434 [Firmicutes bacterium ADurb.BinA205]